MVVGLYNLFERDVSNEKNPGSLGYVGDYTTQSYRDYFINHEIRIPIKQAGFNGKQPRVFRGLCFYSGGH